MSITRLTLLCAASLAPMASVQANPLSLVGVERGQFVDGDRASAIPGPLLDSSTSFADYEVTVDTTLFADAPTAFPIEPDDRDLELIDYALSQSSTITSEADSFTVDFSGALSLLPKSSPPRSLPFESFDYNAIAVTGLALVFDLDVAAVLEFEGSFFNGSSPLMGVETDTIILDAVIRGIVPSGTQIFDLNGPPPADPVFLDLDPGRYTLNLALAHEIFVDDYERRIIGDIDLGFDARVTITVPAPGGLLLACATIPISRRRR